MTEKINTSRLTILRSKYPKLSRIQRLYLDRNVMTVGVILGVYVILTVCVLGAFDSMQEGAGENQLLELSLGDQTLCYIYLDHFIYTGATLVLLIWVLSGLISQWRDKKVGNRKT